jgi:predicted RNA-binding protein with PUA-like domain
MMTTPSFWLMKSEPDVFSLDDLKRAPTGGELWDGVRNYQARNFMRDGMRRGDGVLFYHSTCEVPGVVGLARIANEAAEPDPSQFDPKSEYFDPKSSSDAPRWMARRVEFVAAFPRLVSLRAIKDDADLAAMLVAQRGQRLSIQPVTRPHFLAVCRAGGLPEPLEQLERFGLGSRG